MKTNLTTKKLTALSIVAAIYVVLTVMLGDLSYSNIQFRLSEALILLCFYKREYIYALSVGCLIANIFSGMPLDIIFGTLATVIAAFLVFKAKNIYIASVFPVIVNAIIVGAELNIFYGLPLWLTMAQVALGEFVCVCILGVILFKSIEKNKVFMRIIRFEK